MENEINEINVEKSLNIFESKMYLSYFFKILNKLIIGVFNTIKIKS